MPTEVAALIVVVAYIAGVLTGVGLFVEIRDRDRA